MARQGVLTVADGTPRSGPQHTSCRHARRSHRSRGSFADPARRRGQLQSLLDESLGARRGARLDNDPQGATASALAAAHLPPHVRTLHPGANLGYTVAANRGVGRRAASGCSSSILMRSRPTTAWSGCWRRWTARCRDRRRTGPAPRRPDQRRREPDQHSRHLLVGRIRPSPRARTRPRHRGRVGRSAPGSAGGVPGHWRPVSVLLPVRGRHRSGVADAAGWPGGCAIARRQWWRMTTSSTRALTSGSISSETERGHCSAISNFVRSRCWPGAAGHRGGDPGARRARRVAA